MLKDKETRCTGHFGEGQRNGRNEIATNCSISSSLCINDTMPHAPVVIIADNVNVAIGQTGKLFEVPPTIAASDLKRAMLGAADMNDARAFRETYPSVYAEFSDTLHSFCKVMPRVAQHAMSQAILSHYRKTGVVIEYNNNHLPALVRLHLTDHPADRSYIETRGARCDFAEDVA